MPEGNVSSGQQADSRNLTFLGSLGTFQTGCGFGADKTFYSELELETSKIRRLRLQNRYKFNKSENMTIKTGSDQSCRDCDFWGWGWYVLSGLTGTFYPEAELEQPKTFPAPNPCYQDLHKTGMDRRLSAIGCPLVDMVELKNGEYQDKDSLERKMPKFGLLSNSAEMIGAGLQLVSPTQISLSRAIKT